ncbi:hypothetical protein [Leifsonia sp. Leaf264]|uniref:hypothetical protein n=1 Tax=Leifsonia sp. Leaf264 TaxID=1736314 RepID=UPI00070230AB|nr:hypothetical protein [Leifsonia sp. Leaf264]KQO98626.1 hypothetical protein ASF30_11225 [Leifsonia sp. Leaf264]
MTEQKRGNKTVITNPDGTTQIVDNAGAFAGKDAPGASESSVSNPLAGLGSKPVPASAFTEQFTGHFKKDGVYRPNEFPQFATADEIPDDIPANRIWSATSTAGEVAYTPGVQPGATSFTVTDEPHSFNTPYTFDQFDNFYEQVETMDGDFAQYDTIDQVPDGYDPSEIFALRDSNVTDPRGPEYEVEFVHGYDQDAIYYTVAVAK